MDKMLVAAIATLLGGGLVALQPPINARLAEATGSLPASAVSFGVGFFALLLLSLALSGGAIGTLDASAPPWYYLVGGGLIGATYVTIAIVTVPSLGAAGVTAATVSGQLTASVLADRLGIFGLAEREISVARLVGIALLAAGAFLVIRP